MTRKRLIFVPDVSGLPGKTVEQYLKRKLGAAMPGWRMKNISVYQNTAKVKKPASKYEFDFSQFNTAIRIDREKLSPVVNIFIPIAVMLIVLYIVYWLPSDQIRNRIYLIIAVPIINIFYHVKFLSIFSRGHIDVAIFSVYGLAGIAALMTLSFYLLNKREKIKPVKFIMAAGKIIHPILVLTVGCWIGYRYMS